jgi:hypothetical protein
MIYQLSVNPESKIKGWCFAKRDYLAGEIGITKQGILNMINRLIDSGFIIKDESTKFLKTSEKWNKSYFTDGKQSLPESKQSLLDLGKESLPEAGKESLPNNNRIDNNRINNNNDKHPLQIEFEKTFNDFVDMRKIIKKPLTCKGKELIRNKLNKLSNNQLNIAIEILNNSIENSWQGVFALKSENTIENSNRGGSTKVKAL